MTIFHLKLISRLKIPVRELASTYKRQRKCIARHAGKLTEDFFPADSGGRPCSAGLMKWKVFLLMIA